MIETSLRCQCSKISRMRNDFIEISVASRENLDNCLICDYFLEIKNGGIMLTLLLTLLTLSDTPFSKTDKKRTENEWICSRCRLPAEGSYCLRCGQPYEK